MDSLQLGLCQDIIQRSYNSLMDPLWADRCTRANVPWVGKNRFLVYLFSSISCLVWRIQVYMKACIQPACAAKTLYNYFRLSDVIHCDNCSWADPILKDPLDSVHGLLYFVIVSGGLC